MKKIVLLKDHHRGNEFFKEGQEIEVSDEEFEFLMAYYVDMRKPQVEEQLKMTAVMRQVEKKAK